MQEVQKVVFDYKADRAALIAQTRAASQYLDHKDTELVAKATDLTVSTVNQIRKGAHVNERAMKLLIALAIIEKTELIGFKFQ